MFFNVGSGEVMVIMVIALLVLGPDKLPEAMRQAGRWLGELRKMSDGFRSEVKAAMDDPLEAAARERGAKAVAASKSAAASNPSAGPAAIESSATTGEPSDSTSAVAVGTDDDPGAFESTAAAMPAHSTGVTDSANGALGDGTDPTPPQERPAGPEFHSATAPPAADTGGDSDDAGLGDDANVDVATASGLAEPDA